MKKIITILCLCFAFIFSKGQAITPDDFRLCLDNFGCSDSIIKISKSQLLKAKKFTSNFSWFTIKELTFYFSPEFGLDTQVASCKGDTMCPGLKPILERCGKGAIMTVLAKGKNSSGKDIDWCSLTVKIID